MIAINLVVLVAIAAKNLPAGFTKENQRTFVEIDGYTFGSFDKVDGLEGFNTVVKDDGYSYTKVSLRRNFITEPSLYLWAKNTVKERHGLKDIHLVTRNGAGEEISRNVLKLCQPLTWSVEASNPALGGFHETVELAVKDIASY